MEPLVGCIRYELNLSRAGSVDSSPHTQPKSRGGLHDSIAAQPQGYPSPSTTESPFAGWIFSPHGQSTGSLVVLFAEPLALVATQAHREHRLVRLEKYHRCRLSNAGRPGVEAVQVYAMHMLSTSSPGESSVVCPRETCLSLIQMARWESVASKAERKGRTPLPSVTGLLTTISPIIAVDTADPFCLAELTQATPDADLSCVVVLRQGSLVNHAALRPGQYIAVTAQRRQPWRIPTVLAQLSERESHLRMPSDRVLVVEQAAQIRWLVAAKTVFPSAEASLLPTLQGSITRVQWLVPGNRTTLQSLELTTRQGTSSSRIVSLMVAYFPMDSSLQGSLTVGTEVAAFRLRRLDERVYVATLRSTLRVMQLAPLAREEVPATTGHPFAYNPSQPPAGRTYRWRNTYHRWCQDFEAAQASKGLSTLSPDDVYDCLWGSSFRPTLRNPYAEFFESNEADEESVAREGQRPALYIVRQQEPCLVQLDWLRQFAVSRVQACLRQYLDERKGGISMGWMGSIAIPPSALANGRPVCTGGTTGGPLGLNLTAGLVCLPIVADRQLPEGRLAFVDLNCLTVSVLCMGRSSVAIGKSKSELDLPCFEATDGIGQLGSSQFVILDGKLFLCSVALDGRVSSVSVPGDEEKAGRGKDETNDCPDIAYQTVEECLLPALESQTSLHQTIRSLLVRKSVRFNKAKHGKFNGLCLTLSHTPPEPSLVDRVSSIQSIEVKPVISFDQSIRWKMKRHLESFVGQSCSDELVDTATAWWKIGDCASSCATLFGGWDELATSAGLRLASCRGVHICFPTSTIENDEKRGYVRFRCNLDSIRASVVSFPSQVVTATSPGLPVFDFVGGYKVFPGMLDRRPSRLGRPQTVGHARGELRDAPCRYTAGAPSYTLGDLHKSTCLDICHSSRSQLSPSLVREIRGACYLGVSFCEVFAECTKCFKRLVRPPQARASKRLSSNDTADGLLVVGPTFWHLPLHEAERSTAAPTVPPKSRKRPRTSVLCCRTGCEADYFAIRWECSGTLDDGTGQAKLYAERDAAATLLDMPVATLAAIEEGVWQLEGGLLFSKSVPARNHLRNAVKTAQSVAFHNLKSQARHSTVRLRLDDARVLRHMEPGDRAEYLLQAHCRRSRRPSRPLTYYARCKPLSDAVRFVNHTEVEVAVASDRRSVQGLVTSTTRKAVTYTLPPLKLNLVDLASPTII
jgi:hypothetical protein